MFERGEEMKRRSLFVIVCIMSILFLIITFTVNAATEGDYIYVVNNGEATITGYEGNVYNTLVLIPSQLGGYPVTSIGAGAFNTTGLSRATVVIPEGVTTIGDIAFFQAGVDAVQLPESLKTIGARTFRYCTLLSKINIPASVTSIGQNSFNSCFNLSEIYITDLKAWCEIDFDVTDSYYYGANPLSEGGNLYINNVLAEEIVIPKGITELKKAIFAGYQSVKKVEFSEGITGIGQYAFIDCKNLAEVTIPDTIENIEYRAFYGCDNLANIYFEGKAPEFASYALPNQQTLTAYYPASEEASYEIAKIRFPDVNWVAVNSAIIGDVNGDNTVNFQDAQLVLQHEAGLVTLSAEQLEAADVNGDGTINFQDAQLILQYEAGIIDSFEGSG